MGRRTAVLGIASGLACALCVGAYAFQIDQEARMQRAEALEKYGGAQVEVYVARRDLAAGEIIDDSAVEKRQWLAELLPEGAITDLDSVRGVALGSPVFAGEVMCAGRLKADADQLVVPEGLCALSVPARDVQTVGGSLDAGMEADIYATGPSGSSLLAERVVVLAVGKEGGTGSGNCWVTIGVEPSQVREMVQAAQVCELYFTMPGTAVGSIGGSEEEAAAEASSAAGELEGRNRALEVSGGINATDGFTDSGGGETSRGSGVPEPTIDAAPEVYGAEASEDEMYLRNEEEL